MPDREHQISHIYLKSLLPSNGTLLSSVNLPGLCDVIECLLWLSGLNEFDAPALEETGEHPAHLPNFLPQMVHSILVH